MPFDFLGQCSGAFTDALTTQFMIPKSDSCSALS